VQFSTDPFHTPTHWKQTYFQLDEPVEIDEGSSIEGEIYCTKNPSYTRSYIVKLNIFNQTLNYYVE